MSLYREAHLVEVSEYKSPWQKRWPYNKKTLQNSKMSDKIGPNSLKDNKQILMSEASPHNSCKLVQIQKTQVPTQNLNQVGNQKKIFQELQLKPETHNERKEENTKRLKTLLISKSSQQKKPPLDEKAIWEKTITNTNQAILVGNQSKNGNKNYNVSLNI